MKDTDWTSATVDALVTAYAQAAAEQGHYSEAGDHKRANRRTATIAAIYRELRGRSDDAKEALRPLLYDANEHVRLWAAAHALDFSPSDGEPVLSELTNLRGLAGLNAKMTLREWRQGTLRFR
jgi:hypothetical protein